MKRCNGLYAILVGVLGVFSPAWGMDESQESIILNALVVKANEGIRALDKPDYEKKPLLEDLKKFISDKFTTVSKIGITLDIFNSIASENPNLKDLQTLKHSAYNFYLNKYPKQTCPELQKIFAVYKDEPNMRSFYKQDIAIFIPFLHSQRQNKKILVERFSKTISGEILEKDFSTVDNLISRICSEQTITKQVDAIISSPSSLTEKKQELEKLYKEFLETKPTSDDRQEWNVWIHDDGIIKKAYKALKSPQPIQPTIVQEQISDDLFQSTLFASSLGDLQSDLSDLNKSTLFTDKEIENPLASFKQAYTDLIKDIDFLKHATGPDLATLKTTLADNLEKMNLFIFENDLNVKEQAVVHDSYRCWVLNLIKKAIMTLDTITEEQINDWKKQIETANTVTDKSIEAKKQGELFNSELAFIEELAKEEVEIEPEVKPSQERQALKETLEQQKNRLKENINDLTLLKAYKRNLSEYKKLLDEKAERKLIKNISEQIKTTTQKIKRLSILAPRKKTSDVTTKAKQLSEKLKQLTPQEIESLSLEALNAAITNIKEQYLALEDLDYRSAKKMNPQMLRLITLAKEKEILHEVQKQKAMFMAQQIQKQPEVIVPLQQPLSREEIQQRIDIADILGITPEILDPKTYANFPDEQSTASLSILSQSLIQSTIPGLPGYGNLLRMILNTTAQSELTEEQRNGFRKRITKTLQAIEKTILFPPQVSVQQEPQPTPTTVPPTQVAEQQPTLPTAPTIPTAIPTQQPQPPAQPTTQTPAAIPIAQQIPVPSPQPAPQTPPPTFFETITSYIWQGITNLFSTIASTIRSWFNW